MPDVLTLIPLVWLPHLALLSPRHPRYTRPVGDRYTILVKDVSHSHLTRLDPVPLVVAFLVLLLTEQVHQLLG